MALDGGTQPNINALSELFDRRRYIQRELGKLLTLRDQTANCIDKALGELDGLNLDIAVISGEVRRRKDSGRKR